MTLCLLLLYISMMVHTVFWRVCRSFPPDTLFNEFPVLSLLFFCRLWFPPVSPRCFLMVKHQSKMGQFYTTIWLVVRDFSYSSIMTRSFYSSIRPTSGLILHIHPQPVEVVSEMSSYVSIRQNVSAYFSIRQHASQNAGVGFAELLVQRSTRMSVTCSLRIRVLS